MYQLATDLNLPPYADIASEDLAFLYDLNI